MGETYFQYNTCEKERINEILVQIPGKEFRMLGTYVKVVFGKCYRDRFKFEV